MFRSILIVTLLLGGCYRYSETNPLAIPPIARDELKVDENNKTEVVNEKNN